MGNDEFQDSLCETNTHFPPLVLKNQWSNQQKYKQLCAFPVNLPYIKCYKEEVSYNICLHSAFYSMITYSEIIMSEIYI